MLGDDPKPPPTVAELAAQIDELQQRIMYLTEKLDKVMRAFARIGGIASGLKDDK